jgi:hypothetical protein
MRDKHKERRWCAEEGATVVGRAPRPGWPQGRVEAIEPGHGSEGCHMNEPWLGSGRASNGQKARDLTWVTAPGTLGDVWGHVAIRTG